MKKKKKKEKKEERNKREREGGEEGRKKFFLSLLSCLYVREIHICFKIPETHIKQNKENSIYIRNTFAYLLIHPNNIH